MRHFHDDVDRRRGSLAYPREATDAACRGFPYEWTAHGERSPIADRP